MNTNIPINTLKEAVTSKRARLRYSDRGRESAVMLPLVERNGVWHILFQVRSSRLNLQPGDICFPGGGVEGEEFPQETALRETCEELLIEENQIELLGEIDGTIGPTGMPMWAFACILHDYQDTFSKDEVAEIFMVPLQDLLEMKPAVGKTALHVEMLDGFPVELLPGKEYKWHGREQNIPFYPWRERMIWGATARILYNFLERF